MTTLIRRFDSNIVTPLQLEDISANTELLSIPLPGYGNMSYHINLNEANVWKLENFARSTPPALAIRGQAWFNTGTTLVYYYDGDDGTDSTIFPGNWKVPVDITMADLTAHVTDYNNPHQVTAAQVGLGNVINAPALLVSNNLSDLGDASTARDNLDVYDTGYIDDTFTSTVDAINANLVGNYLFSQLDNSYGHTFYMHGDTGFKFTNETSKPITFDTSNNKILVTVNDVYDFNIKGGMGAVPGVPNSDTYHRAGSGAAMVSLDFSSSDGKVIIAAKNQNGIGGAITFTNKLEVTEDTLKWSDDLVLTDIGFTIKGNIIPTPSSSMIDLVANTTTGGIDLGSISNHFNKTYTREITTSTIIHEDTTVATVVPTDAVFAYKSGTNEIKYTDYESMVTAFRGGFDKETIIIEPNTLWASNATSNTLLTDRYVRVIPHTLGTVPSIAQVSIIVDTPFTVGAHTYQIGDEIPVPYMTNAAFSVSGTDVVFTRSYTETSQVTVSVSDNPHTGNGTDPIYTYTTVYTYNYNTESFPDVDFTPSSLYNRKLKITLIK